MLAKHPEGVREGEMQDAYPGAAKDLVPAKILLARPACAHLHLPRDLSK